MKPETHFFFFASYIFLPFIFFLSFFFCIDVTLNRKTKTKQNTRNLTNIQVYIYLGAWYSPRIGGFMWMPTVNAQTSNPSTFLFLILRVPHQILVHLSCAVWRTNIEQNRLKFVHKKNQSIKKKSIIFNSVKQDLPSSTTQPFKNVHTPSLYSPCLQSLEYGCPRHDTKLYLMIRIK